MRKFIMSLTTVASLSLAAVPVLGLTQAANAAERDVSVTVSLADLNLSNPAQAALFKARVQQASETVCRAKLHNNDLQMSFGQCITAAHRDVEHQLSAGQRKALTYAARATATEVAAR